MQKRFTLVFFFLFSVMFFTEAVFAQTTSRPCAAGGVDLDINNAEWTQCQNLKKDLSKEQCKKKLMYDAALLRFSKEKKNWEIPEIQDALGRVTREVDAFINTKRKNKDPDTLTRLDIWAYPDVPHTISYGDPAARTKGLSKREDFVTNEIDPLVVRPIHAPTVRTNLEGLIGDDTSSGTDLWGQANSASDEMLEHQAKLKLIVAYTALLSNNKDYVDSTFGKCLHESLVEMQDASLKLLGQTTSNFDVNVKLSVGNEHKLTLLDDGKDQVSIFGRVIRLFTQIFGTLGVLLLIIGAVIMITSRGDDSQLTKGKNIVIYTIFGILIAYLGLIIVQFVLSLIFIAS